MTQTQYPTRPWSMTTAIEQITACGFECEAGPLANNEGWQWLVSAAKKGPQFWPGQGVWFELSAEVAGQKLTKMAHFFIIGCRMEPSSGDRLWTYDLSNDPPGPYHAGNVQFRNISASQLHLRNPESP